MRADVEEFARLAGVAPREGQALPWAAAGQSVGIELPTDYRAFVDAFGRGEVYERLGINAPMPRYDPAAGDRALQAMLDDAAETGTSLIWLRDKHPQFYPYAFYPEPGGLLAWGGGIGGELCFWRTAEPDSDDWTVVVWDKRNWRHYDLNMVGVLLLTVSGTDRFLRMFFAPGAPVWTADR